MKSVKGILLLVLTVVLGGCEVLDPVLSPTDGELCLHTEPDGGCRTYASCDRDCAPGDVTFGGQKDVARFQACTPPPGACQ